MENNNNTLNFDKVKNEAERQGMKLLEVKTIPNNNLLLVTLCEKESIIGKEYVTHIFNTDFYGLFHGHYYKDYELAFEDFNKRV